MSTVALSRGQQPPLRSSTRAVGAAQGATHSRAGGKSHGPHMAASRGRREASEGIVEHMPLATIYASYYFSSILGRINAFSFPYEPVGRGKQRENQNLCHAFRRAAPSN